MGTSASCRLMVPSSLATTQAESLVQGTFTQVDSALSTWIPGSELCRLNRAPADSLVLVSSLLAPCLKLSRTLRDQSGGAFDPALESLMRAWGFYDGRGRFPGQATIDSILLDQEAWSWLEGAGAVVKRRQGIRFDLGGIAKGWALDLACRKLRAAGMVDGLLDLGGNLFCLGGAPGRQNWRVGIRDPRRPDEMFATLEVSGQSVATSGSYERFVEVKGRHYGHIMDPARGRPATGLLSVTVVASEGILADGLSTTLFVLGKERALEFLEEYYPGVEAVLVVPDSGDGRDLVLTTPGLRDCLVIRPGWDNKYLLANP